MPAFRELFLLWKSKRFFEKALEEAVIQGKSMLSDTPETKRFF